MNNTFKVAGITFRLSDFHDAEVKPGDALALVPDPSNAYDPEAIKVMKRGAHIGFVPRTSTVQVRAALAAKATAVVESCGSRNCVVRLVEAKKKI